MGFGASQNASYEEYFDQLFDSMPLPMWEVDASKLEPWFQELRQQGVTDLGAHFDAGPGILDRAISLISMIRMNRRAKIIARAEGRSSEPGPIDPVGIRPVTRRIIREQMIGHFRGEHHVDVEISAEGDDSDGGGLRVVTWTRPTDDGELDLSSVFTTVLDLRSFRRRESERRIALEQFERVFENAAVGISILDRTTGVLTRVNRAYTEMLGYPIGGLDGVHLSEITPESAMEYLDFYIDPDALDVAGVAAFERPYQHRDGSVRWAMVSIRSTDPDMSIAVVVDVTDLRAERLARAEVEKVLERKVAELQTFAWTAAHDLSEPLRKIRTFGGRLSDTAGDVLDDRSRDYLDRMESAAGRMQGLIDGLLAYSRVTTRVQPFEWVDLGDVVRGVVADLEVAITETGATVEIGVLPTLMGEPTQMRQLIQNLLTNSLKYRSVDRQLVVSISGHSDDDSVVFWVTDNGMGFEPGQSEQVFGLFERLVGRSEIPGYGMGLAIVAKIVEIHGGSIVAESTPDNGATFTIRIPAAQREDGADHG